jgi:hypothetical protein
MQGGPTTARRLNGKGSYDFPRIGEDALAKLRQSVDDAKSQVIPESDLHHLGGELLSDQSHILRSELQLPSTPIDEMIDEQGRQVLNFLITGVLAQI